MPQKAAEFKVFEKTSHGAKSWYVYYRDSNGKRLSELSLQKLKKDLGLGSNPIADKEEAKNIATKALCSEKLKEKIFNRKTDSPLFYDFVNEIWNYEDSAYLRRRKKEKKVIILWLHTHLSYSFL